MKTKSLSHPVVLFASFLIPSSLQALDVHEWGTFTVLVSSQGQTVNWYQPYSDIAKLPPFIMLNNAMMMKSFVPAARVRMETPVIYFYPEEETTVSVRVAFAKGRITERFPVSTDTPFTLNPLGISSAPMSLQSGLSSTHPLIGNNLQFLSCAATLPTSDQLFNQRMREQTVSTPPTVVRWMGKLLPPNHEDAKLIPAVAAQEGENYAAARNVPDAWLFKSDVPNQFISGTQQIEKFIFYRGAGDSLPPYSVSMPNDNTVAFVNQSQSASTFQVALRVRDGKAMWMQLPNIAGPQVESPRFTSMAFPEKSISLEQADQELRALFLSELINRGLTKSEAQAMIDTWNHTWFAEPGQRVFTIVDRTWVDSVLPLGITPEPKKIERVFVARYELLSPASEKQLTAIMTQQAPNGEKGTKIADLNLGRFSNGAAELVAESLKQEYLNQFRTQQSEELTPVKVEP